MAQPNSPLNSASGNLPPILDMSDSGADATLTDILDDHEDLKQAQTSEEDCQVENRPWWKCLGPGLITGAADDDPSGIGTYSVAGAQFGYGLLWMVPLCIPLMIVIQEMCGRIGVITGKGLSAVLKEHFPRWILYSAVLLLGVANVANIYADLNVMAASGKMLFGGSEKLWLAGITAAIITMLIYIPYKNYVRVLKWLALALVAYIITPLLPGVHLNWKQIGIHTFLPVIHLNTSFLLTLVGILGTTISPYLFFWQAGEQVEEQIVEGKSAAPGLRVENASQEEIRRLRTDTTVGMITSQAVTFFIMICTAATLNALGKTDINSAQDAAAALKPLGNIAYTLFTVGIIGTGMLAIPTLAGSAAYSVAETFGWRYGLYRRFRRARGFYYTIGAAVILGYLLNFIHGISPIKALLYSAVVNGVVAVPMMILLMLICNNEEITKGHKNNLLSNIVGWFTILLMGAASVIMIWALVTGKAS